MATAMPVFMMRSEVKNQRRSVKEPLAIARHPRNSMGLVKPIGARMLLENDLLPATTPPPATSSLCQSPVGAPDTLKVAPHGCLLAAYGGGPLVRPGK